MRHARISARTIAAIALTTLFAGTLTLSSGSASSASCQRWGAQPINPGVESELHGVASGGACKAYVVGYYVDAQGTRWSLMELWDGSDWTVMPGATIEGGNLYDVVFTSSTTGWAVGSVAVPGEFGRLILRWNGTTWKRVTTSPTYDFVALRALSRVPGSKRVWAVGSRRNSNEDDEAIALQWNGTSWVERPIIYGKNERPGRELHDVQAIENSYALAVGTDYNNAPLFLRWNGKEWKKLDNPFRFMVGVFAHVHSVRGGDTDDAWAVGSYSESESAPARTLVLRWNGKQWRKVDSPNVGDFANVLTAVNPGFTRMWAVGYYNVPDGAGGYRQRTLVMSWDPRHKQWEIQNSLNISSGDNQLLAIDTVVPGRTAWAVGSYDDTSPQPMALTCC